MRLVDVTTDWSAVSGLAPASICPSDQTKWFGSLVVIGSFNCLRVSQQKPNSHLKLLIVLVANRSLIQYLGITDSFGI